jgi:enoyl-CoA hydratase
MVDETHDAIAAALADPAVRLLRGSRKPLLAAINGTAVGGGLEMTLHCDQRFAASDAKLGQPEINIGFIPPIATTQALARLIGRPRAIRYLYDGTLVSAAETLDRGLVDELVEPADLRARVQALELKTVVQLAGTPDFAEGVDAFLAKRQPKWKTP